jgi:hypothetical protein
MPRSTIIVLVFGAAMSALVGCTSTSMQPQYAAKPANCGMVGSSWEAPPC